VLVTHLLVGKSYLKIILAIKTYSCLLYTTCEFPYARVKSCGTKPHRIKKQHTYTITVTSSLHALALSYRVSCIDAVYHRGSCRTIPCPGPTFCSHHEVPIHLHPSTITMYLLYQTHVPTVPYPCTYRTVPCTNRTVPMFLSYRTYTPSYCTCLCLAPPLP